MTPFFTRVVLKLHKLATRFLNKHQLIYVKSQLKSCGTNLTISFPIDTYGLDCVKIANNVKLGLNCKLRTFSDWESQSYSPEISIGNNVNIQDFCHISAIDSVTIEDNVLIASFVYISDISHGNVSSDELDIPPINRPLTSKGPIRICKNVWLGERVCVMPGVTIGEGSIVGANSVVTHDIPPYSVAVGAPAKVLKRLR